MRTIYKEIAHTLSRLTKSTVYIKSLSQQCVSYINPQSHTNIHKHIYPDGTPLNYQISVIIAHFNCHFFFISLDINNNNNNNKFVVICLGIFHINFLMICQIFLIRLSFGRFAF